MTRAIVIVDTNVVAAGLITAQESSAVARVLDGMLAAVFPYVVSEALLSEYRTVLARPGLRKHHGLKIAEVETLLTDVALHATVLSPAPGPPAPDPGDQLLWDLLAARSDLILITGDKRLQRDAGMQGRVISPREFIARE